MREAAQTILAALDAAKIPYQIAHHPAAFTMADCVLPEQALSCVIPKNLFLTPRNKKTHFLCITLPDTPFRTADISKQIPSPRLSFAEETELAQFLHTYAGAASPLGLLFDRENSVRFLMDEALLQKPVLGFHPNDNEYTVAMETSVFIERFLPLTGHDMLLIHAEQTA